MSNFTPRLTVPDPDDLRWIKVESGGYNQCIYGAYGPPSVLPNCTGYVHGRAMEIAGVNSDTLGLSFGDACEYYSGSSPDWVQSSEPSLGAIACYYQISTGWAPGHVAVVEEIIDADTVVISESNYSTLPGTYFRTWTIRREWNWSPFPDPSDYLVSFQGFLTNPYVQPEPPAPSGKGKYAILLLAGKRKRRDQNGRIKRNSDLI